jgi:cysteine-rich repeat protein
MGKKVLTFLCRLFEAGQVGDGDGGRVMRSLGLFFASMFSILAFTVPAQAAPVCGNSVVESGEDCDDDNTDPGDCCSPTCEFESAATVCRGAAGMCDIEEVCDGVNSHCPVDAVEPITTECRPAVQICDATEYCDGVSTTCPITLPANAPIASPRRSTSFRQAVRGDSWSLGRDARRG